MKAALVDADETRNALASAIEVRHIKESNIGVGIYCAGGTGMGIGRSDQDRHLLPMAHWQ
jgi:hypothetical protein